MDEEQKDLNDLNFGTGAMPDPEDLRDFKYEVSFGASPITEEDWDKGFDAFEHVGLKPIMQDQNGSSSCVGQSVKSYTRRVLASIGETTDELSARDVYSHIFLGNGGAFIRDGVLFPATRGILKHEKATDYENGNPPSEAFMRQKTRKTEEDEILGKKLDKFTGRVFNEGDISNIDTFAHAIKNHLGAVGGFTGTNEGWSRSVVRPPKGIARENKWGHAVDLCAFGKLDVAVDGMPVGTKCIFTPNSWGNRYAIKEGRWKGYQAIPEEYFTASFVLNGVLQTAFYVFNPWVLVPDEDLSLKVKAMDFIKRNSDRIVQLTEPNVPGSGSFVGIIVGDELRTVELGKLETVPELKSAVELLLTCLVRNKLGSGIDKQTLDALPKRPLK